MKRPSVSLPTSSLQAHPAELPCAWVRATVRKTVSSAGTNFRHSDFG